MKVRIISSLILIPLLFAVYSGGPLLKLIGFIIALVALKEFYDAFKNIQIVPIYGIGVFCCVLLYALDITGRISRYFSFWVFATVFIVLIYGLFSKGVGIKNGALTLVGIFYIVFCSYHVILIDGIVGYRYLIWFVFITAFVTDTSAYFAGYLFGKHKLWPEISPKKTIEGAIGGVIGSVVVSVIVGYLIAPQLILHFIILGIIGSVAGQIGDLVASAFKRISGIKDFGNLIPGHGGVLDRFDSVLLTAPVVYYYTVLFIM
ncbi:MAG: phosphatidate cytidylyltransferase [Clostridiales bacterium]|nr:phosphatidate cytidylyltransferase [Clostridiales bacterium]